MGRIGSRGPMRRESPATIPFARCPPSGSLPAMPAATADTSLVFDWFQARYGEPTPAQRAAWPRIARGENVLVASPTGTGKTFAAFFSVLDALAREDAAGELRDG